METSEKKNQTQKNQENQNSPNPSRLRNRIDLREKTDPKVEINKFGNAVLEQINKMESPKITLPVRALSNTFFDEKTKLIQLGNKTSSRFYLNVAHTRKFMQTLLVASECKNIINQNVTTSIRDLYYALKRTLPGTSENTFEDQNESLCPDEPVLVKMENQTQIVPAKEVVDFAYKTGRISENNGKTIISDVPIYTYAFDENLEVKEHKIKAVLKHPSKEAVEIKTTSGRKVKITPYHSLFTLNNEGNICSAKVSELRKNDYIALPKKIRIKNDRTPINLVMRLLENAPENVLKKIYLKGERVTIEKIINSIEKKALKEPIQKKYKTIWSNEVFNWKNNSSIPIWLIKQFNLYSYIPDLKIGCKGGEHLYSTIIKKDYNLGLLFGHLISEASNYEHKKRKNERCVSISNKSKIFINEFSKTFEKVFRDRCATKDMLLGKDGVYNLNIGYNTFSYILEYAFSYGCINSWEKEVPSFLFDAPDDCVKGFIRGFREGDGSCYKPKPKLRFHTSSLGIVNGLTFLLLRLGIFPRIYDYPKKQEHHHRMFELRVGTREDIIKLSSITNDFKDGVSERKSSVSYDKIPNIGKIIRKARKECKLPEKIYKKFDWYSLENDSGAVNRKTLKTVINTLKKYNAKKEDLSPLELLINSDIFWDQVKEIKAAEKPEYTIDFAVNPTQNFIGGNGLVILHNSDPILEDLEAALNTLREKLHLQADRKGYMAGPITIQDKDDTIDCTRMGSSGWAVPSNVEPEMIRFKDCTADYCIIIEKDAVWQRLNEDKFWKKNNCLILTGKGQPARGTRRLINRMNNELKIPMYTLVDSDPWGAYIYSVIKQGSINLSFLSDRLGTPSAKFVGLSINDVHKFNIPKNVTIKLNQGDVKRINEMLKYVWFQPKEWQHELKTMLQVGYKLELEALSSKGIKFISEKYLPQKIEQKDFLP